MCGPSISLHELCCSAACLPEVCYESCLLNAYSLAGAAAQASVSPAAMHELLHVYAARRQHLHAAY